MKRSGRLTLAQKSGNREHVMTLVKKDFLIFERREMLTSFVQIFNTIVLQEIKVKNTLIFSITNVKFTEITPSLFTYKDKTVEQKQTMYLFIPRKAALVLINIFEQQGCLKMIDFCFRHKKSFNKQNVKHVTQWQFPNQL
eukprot:TRINITY_DN6151_c0_g2_i1.p1 TRINITY_DN6151_c0_g2~~TRINITY_DN6151_c0_g2_i1.p1  ORF type:complete len:140 (+),score=0.20 TRINITY_DN6151_c0_g2_i1:144-563(+)